MLHELAAKLCAVSYRLQHIQSVKCLIVVNADSALLRPDSVQLTSSRLGMEIFSLR